MDSFFFNILSALLLRRAELLTPKNSDQPFNCDVGCIYENVGPRSQGLWSVFLFILKRTA